MKIKEILDSSVSFGCCNFKPGDVFYYEEKNDNKDKSSYYIVTDMHDCFHMGGTPCINLKNGKQRYFSSATAVIPCIDIELSLRR